MKTQVQQSEHQSRTLDANPKASRQASIDLILQAYKSPSLVIQMHKGKKIKYKSREFIGPKRGYHIHKYNNGSGHLKGLVPKEKGKGLVLAEVAIIAKNSNDLQIILDNTDFSTYKEQIVSYINAKLGNNTVH